MSNLLALATLNSSAVLLPAYLPTPAALSFWLTNPLLLAKYPKKVAASAEQAPALSLAQQMATLLRLKATRDKLRHFPCGNSAEAMPKKELLALVDRHDTLLDLKERVSVRAFAFSLHSQEVQWYHDFLQNAFRLREAMLDEQHEQDEFDEQHEQAA